MSFAIFFNCFLLSQVELSKITPRPSVSTST